MDNKDQPRRRDEWSPQDKGTWVVFTYYRRFKPGVVRGYHLRGVIVGLHKNGAGKKYYRIRQVDRSGNKCNFVYQKRVTAVGFIPTPKWYTYLKTKLIIKQ